MGMLGILQLSHGQNVAFICIEFEEPLLGPFIQRIDVLLQLFTVLLGCNLSEQFSVVCEKKET